MDVELFIHVGVDWRKDWQITEVKSGSRICTGRTKKEVVEKATAKFEQYTAAEIAEILAQAIKEMEKIKKKGGLNE